MVDIISSDIVQCYGISQDPITKNYVMVMRYMKEDNLRNYLKNNYSKLNWLNKIKKLSDIARGLYNIHSQNLIHRDFHSGNVLNSNINYSSHITDLGLSKPADMLQEEGKIFGVLPYVAPEVLQSKPYTQKSDIYSFGIIAYELLSGLPPYYDREHDISLALQICQGLRSQFQIKLPPLLEELINKCWDSFPENRPSAWELKKTLSDWYKEINNNKITEFTQQIQEAEVYNNTLPENIRFPKYEIHQGAVYHSKAINTQQITKLLSKEINGSSEIPDMADLLDKFTDISIKDEQADPQEQSSLQAQIETPPK